MPGLIVSVRARREVDIAIAGGATLVDAKEPRLGSLGRADHRLIEFVLERAANRMPVSAAMGELRDDAGSLPQDGLAYVKWGLAGYGNRHWRSALSRLKDRLGGHEGRPKPVVVAYADWGRARSPRPRALCNFACKNAFAAFLIDTWQKDGRNLLDWMTFEEVAKLRAQCRSSGVGLALAGSLGVREISRLCEIEPDWFAVRGAVCRRGLRGQSIDLQAVKAIARVCKDGYTSSARKLIKRTRNEPSTSLAKN
jgi:(5-formylfuran-3-yl)methyl phosphate synthase